MNQQPVNRTRRAFFVFALTGASLMMASFLVITGYAGPLVEQFVGSLMSLVETLALLYLGASVIDRSNVLGRIGDGLANRGNTLYAERPEGEVPPVADRGVR